MMVEPISERIIIMRLMMKPMNMLIVQIYAPCEDEDEEEKDQFYEALDQTLKEYKKGRECLVVMGDFNEKVGNGREENIIGPYGLGTRNENGERLMFLQEALLVCNKHLVPAKENGTTYLDLAWWEDNEPD